ncbi:MAG: ABC transporter ATP-binding protein [Nitrospirota bacterium]
MPPAISVKGLSKQYRIGAREEAARTFREALVDLAAAPVRRLRRLGRPPEQEETIWALQDVSFDVQPGEVVGVIGRNGAGKSTLLKILTRITEPTEGRVELRGRVASLLEVGTGFHPELTGRENIYLNGVILGMKKAEIDRKFDEIVAFAEIEKFLDTPVKHYSSGMYVRLAFAVAAHLEPEILLVDEVLAVGDAAFQKKCLGKMGAVAKEGRTVLFVSHNMQAIRQLCKRGCWLGDGRVMADGPSDEVVNRYLKAEPKANGSGEIPRLIAQLPADPAFRLERIALLQAGQLVEQHVLNGHPLDVVIHYQVLQKTTGLRVFFDLYDGEETLLFRSFHDADEGKVPTMEPGRYVSKAVIPANFLAPTAYEIRILATVYNVRMCIPYPGICIPLHVDAVGGVNRAYMAAGEPIRGKLAPMLSWTTFAAEKTNVG